jgi:hypothetical protein
MLQYKWTLPMNKFVKEDIIIVTSFVLLLGAILVSLGIILNYLVA